MRRRCSLHLSLWNRARRSDNSHQILFDLFVLFCTGNIHLHLTKYLPCSNRAIGYGDDHVSVPGYGILSGSSSVCIKNILHGICYLPGFGISARFQMGKKLLSACAFCHTIQGMDCPVCFLVLIETKTALSGCRPEPSFWYNDFKAHASSRFTGLSDGDAGKTEQFPD